MAKIYKRIGLRQDRNLSDLSSSRDALNNLLDAFAATGDDADATFISEDLDCIRNIFAEGMTPEIYQEMGGSATESTTSAGSNILFKPRITFQNRLDVCKVFAGEPRIRGGNGLTATYYDKDRIFENTIGVWSGTPFKQDNFWERGNFNWTRKIHPNAADENGGIDWEGWFIPTITGRHYFRCTSTGCVSMEFETEGYTSGIGTYTEHVRIGIASTAACTGTSGTNIITLADADDLKNVGTNQIVTNSNIATGTIIDGVNYSTREITLFNSSAANAVTGTVNGNVTFSKEVGTDIQTRMDPGYVLERAQRYRIRFRYFIPQSFNASNVERKFDVDLLSPENGGSGSSETLHYTQLYSKDYDFSDAAKGVLANYLDTSILFGGGTLGLNPTTLADANNEVDYVTVKSSKKVDVRYTIEDKTISYAERRTFTGTATAGSRVIAVSDTTYIEIGNYVYDNTNLGVGATKVITDGTRVRSFEINQAIILDTPAVASGSVEIKIVDHRGLVQRIIGNSPSGTPNTIIELTTDYDDGLNTGAPDYDQVGAGVTWSGRVLIGNNIGVNTKISLNGTTNGFSINPSRTNNINTLQSMYIYESEGLVNNSLTAFCTPKTGSSGTRCVSVTSDVAANATTLPVSSTTDITVGDTVLGFYFSSGTTVSSTDPSSLTITINQGTTDIIKSGNNFTITRDSGDRSLCCPPKDTSPPFAATDDGMITKSDFATVNIESGNILFGSLRADMNNSRLTTDTSTIPTEQYNKEIGINCNGTTYKLLAT